MNVYCRRDDFLKILRGYNNIVAQYKGAEACTYHWVLAGNKVRANFQASRKSPNRHANE